jgi:HSP20 family protein
MLHTRWRPALWRELDRVNQEMGRVFAATYPAVNLWEDGENFYVQAELPGVPADKLEVVVSEQNLLTLSGERPQAEAGKGAWHRRERGAGKFRRELTLPAAVEADTVEAHFEHGVLSLKLPKAAEARARRITVRAD